MTHIMREVFGVTRGRRESGVVIQIQPSVVWRYNRTADKGYATPGESCRASQVHIHTVHSRDQDIRVKWQKSFWVVKRNNFSEHCSSCTDHSSIADKLYECQLRWSPGPGCTGALHCWPSQSSETMAALLQAYLTWQSCTLRTKLILDFWKATRKHWNKPFCIEIQTVFPWQ